MAKHAQTIRRQKPAICLSVFDHHFVKLALKRLRKLKDFLLINLSELTIYSVKFKIHVQIVKRQISTP